MPKQELLDYIKTQRSIGVTEEQIVAALKKAGYDDLEIQEHISHKGSRPSTRKLSFELKHLLFLNILIIVLFVAVAIYFSYDFHKSLNAESARSDASIEALRNDLINQNAVLTDRISNSEKDWLAELEKLRKESRDEDKALRSTIANADSASKERDATLASSIQDISSQSSAKLDQLSKDLDTFKSEQVDFSKIAPKAMHSVVTIGYVDSSGVFQSDGSGAIISRDGFVLTNYHVVDELRNIVVNVDDNKYQADMVGKNTTWDLALLKMKTDDKFVPFYWADSDKLYVGQPVIAIGNPVGLEASVTQGIISSKRRYIDDNPDIPYIQTDVAINPGNSGGPLIDKDGKIVGILTMKYTGSGIEGLGFAIASNDAKRVANELKLHPAS